jgi:hypothetical protein
MGIHCSLSADEDTPGAEPAPDEQEETPPCGWARRGRESWRS